MKHEPVTHYEPYETVEYGYAPPSPCGAYSDKHEYSSRDEDVTCAKCLKALGFTRGEDE